MSFLLLMVFSAMLPTTASEDPYSLGQDSKPQEGVPQGTVEARTWNTSRIYPGVQHDYWVYVPAQYTDAEPACVMVFQDGHFYVSTDGDVRVPTVFDNLIHRGEMPVAIAVFINPGQKEQTWDQRDRQYTPLDDTYTRFLLEEILPAVGADYNLTQKAVGRAIGGWSDGGLVSFTAAWERPDAFSKVVSQVGSYTRLRGGSEYPYRIRKTRGNPKPIRVFLQGGQNDLNLAEGNWTLANLEMESALQYARYDFRFEMGTGGHDVRHGGAIFPETMRWLWRDYPGVENEFSEPRVGAATGTWDVTTNLLGRESLSVLTISNVDGALAATLTDQESGELEVREIRFDADVLSYAYLPPDSQNFGAKGKGAEADATMEAWVRVTGDTFKGALSAGLQAEVDYTIRGQRRP